MSRNEKLMQIINNLNESGLALVLNTAEVCTQFERYNINTSSERLEELQRISEEEKRLTEKDESRLSYEMAKAECKRQREFKASLAGQEKRFFDTLESVRIPAHYDMKHWQMILLADTYDNNLIDGLSDILKFGFMKGQRAEKSRAKKERKS